MKARMYNIMLALILAVTSSAMALSPIGPAQAVIGENQWGIGANIGYQNMDLVADGTYFELHSGPNLRQTNAKIAMKDIQTVSSFAQIGFGLTPEIDIYASLGASNAVGNTTAKNSNSTVQTHGLSEGEPFDIHGNQALAWGVGTRFTLKDLETVKWGGVAQITFHNPKGNSTWTSLSDSSYHMDGTWDMQYWELIVALGPTIVYDNVQFYGGPFLHMVRGDMDFNGVFADNTTDNGPAYTSMDMEEEALVGAYAGMQMDLYENLMFYVDGQYTGKAWGVGIGAMMRTK